MNKIDWLNAIVPDKTGVVPPFGIQITCHIILESEEDYRYINEIIDMCRESGSAYITKQVQLEGDE